MTSIDSYQTHDDLVSCSFLSPEVPNLSPLGTVPYFNFSPSRKGLGLSFLSPCYICLVITLLTFLYVLFELLSAFSFWTISFRTSQNPPSMQRPWPLRSSEAHSHSPLGGDQITSARPIICAHGQAKKKKKVICPHTSPQFIFSGHQCDNLEAHRSYEAWKFDLHTGFQNWKNFKINTWSPASLEKSDLLILDCLILGCFPTWQQLARAEYWPLPLHRAYTLYLTRVLITP